MPCTASKDVRKKLEETIAGQLIPTGHGDTPCLYGMPGKLRGFGWELMITAGGQAGYRSRGGEQLYFVLFIYLGFHSSLSLLVMA